MALPKFKDFLLRLSLLVMFSTIASSAYSQSDDQMIVRHLIDGDRESAQSYMDRLSRVDARRIQCSLLFNYNYITDYKSEIFNQENAEWFLDNFLTKGYPWPASCDYRDREYEMPCLIFGVDISMSGANYLRRVFEALDVCRPDNLGCHDIYINYSNAIYTDTYLYVVERYFNEANPADRSRSNCGAIDSWAEAILQTHTGYFKVGWAIYSDFQLESGARSLQKALDGMQSLVTIDTSILQEAYEYHLQEMTNTDSNGAREVHRMFVSTLQPYIEN